MPVYLIEPAAEPTSTPDYGSGISGIRSELSSIDTDTTAIAVSLATMATNSTNISTKINTVADKVTIIADKQTTIADKQATIADKQTIIAEMQTAMETYQKKLKELGEGDGMHVLGPYEYFGMISIYKRLIEEGKILDDATIQKSATKEAKERVENYSQAFNDLPRYR